MCATSIPAATFRSRREHTAARVAGEPVQAPHTHSEDSRVSGRYIDYIEDRAVGNIELPGSARMPVQPGRVGAGARRVLYALLLLQVDSECAA
jgi:hypothetical protein